MELRAFLIYDLRLSARDADRLTPVELFALLERRTSGRKWLCAHFAKVVAASATIDGRALKPWEICAELHD